jgi:DNA-binding beta-propeller fold protein YncE
MNVNGKGRRRDPEEPDQEEKKSGRKMSAKPWCGRSAFISDRLWFSLLAGLAMGSAAAVRVAAGPLSPLALVADARGETLYVIEAGAARLAEVEMGTGRVRREIALPGEPAALALHPAGGQLAVAGGGVKGEVWLVDRTSGRVSATLAAGHTPSAVLYDRAGLRLFVCNRFFDEVQVFTLAPDAASPPASVSAPTSVRLRTGREPVALALSPDGRILVVAHLLPEGRADEGEVAAEVTLLDTTALRPLAQVRLPNGSTGLRGVAISPDGEWAYVTHILGRYQSPTTQLERGWMNTNAITLIELRAHRRRATFLLDSVEQGAANPWGVACSADGAWLVVAHAGSHEISVIDRPALHRKLAAAGPEADPLDNLDFLAGMQRRVRLAGRGPRGLIVAGANAYSVLYFSDRIAGVPLTVGNAETGASSGWDWALGPEEAPTAERLGELAFHDASRCFQRWQSCSSCHPDARVDALNWDLMNDGLGNPKNTKSMVTAHATPPAMWLGVRPSAEMAVRSGFKHIQFAVVDDKTTAAVDKYLAGLHPVPSPRLVQGQLSPAARRGEKVFDAVGCASCHPAPLYTDLKRYDLGTTQGVDAGRPVDVPTLLEGWRTAPYLHDGSAATLRDVLTTRNPDKRHGDLSGLKPIEVDDLVEYLQSL